MTTPPTTIPPKDKTPSSRANGHEAAASKPPPPVPDALPEADAVPVDVTVLSKRALSLLVQLGQAELDRRQQKEESDFLAGVCETARALRIAPERVAAALDRAMRQRAPKPSLLGPASARPPGKDRRSEVAPKYRNPADGQTWSGRGQPPPWIELGTETNPKTGKPLPLAKFRIVQDDDPPSGPRRV